MQVYTSLTTCTHVPLRNLLNLIDNIKTTKTTLILHLSEILLFLRLVLLLGENVIIQYHLLSHLAAL